MTRTWLGFLEHVRKCDASSSSRMNANEVYCVVDFVILWSSVRGDVELSSGGAILNVKAFWEIITTRQCDWVTRVASTRVWTCVPLNDKARSLAACLGTDRNNVYVSHRLFTFPRNLNQYFPSHGALLKTYWRMNSINMSSSAKFFVFCLTCVLQQILKRVEGFMDRIQWLFKVKRSLHLVCLEKK